MAEQRAIEAVKRKTAEIREHEKKRKRKVEEYKEEKIAEIKMKESIDFTRRKAA